MDAGRLRDRVVIERPVTSREGTFNSKTTTWVPVVRGGVWAEVKDVADRSTEDSGDKLRKNTRRRQVLIRWMAAIDTKMRLKVNDETVYFQIVNMADIGFRDGIQLMVEEYRS